MAKEIKRSRYKPAPISEESYDQLENKYGIPKSELRNMARELGLGKPKLEMHLICLAAEKRKASRGGL